MASTVENVLSTVYFPVVATATETGSSRQIYEANRHRIYSLCFWMTDNELAAEDLSEATFRRAFSRYTTPSFEDLDRALIAELRRTTDLGELSLCSERSTQILNARSNTLRVHLERALVQLPPTERLVFLLHDVEGYDHSRIARYLGFSRADSQNGLYQARLRLRELLAGMRRS